MTEQIKEAMTRPRVTRSIHSKSDLLHSGSTLLNLNSTGYAEGAIAKGTYVLMPGDSSSGKTFICRTILAEATINEHFKDYRLIYDDVEGGALMDTKRYFGDSLAERLKAPDYDDDGDPLYSETIEDFYFNLHDNLSEGKPVIYILDSMDGLSSMYEGKKFQEKKEKGDRAKGDYGDGKAKINKSGMRQIIPLLKETGSILIVICQTIDVLDSQPFGPKKTRSGGWALKFFAHAEWWTSVGPAIKMTVKGKDRKVGITSRVRIKKNRSTGREREIDVPIYYSCGIDDVGSMVDYLIDEKKWPKNKQGFVDAVDLDVKKRREALIEHIEDNDLELKLRNVVVATWKDIEAACEVKRKRRYE